MKADAGSYGPRRLLTRMRALEVFVAWNVNRIEASSLWLTRHL